MPAVNDILTLSELLKNSYTNPVFRFLVEDDVNSSDLPEVYRIIFQPNIKTTIVFWDDGDRTIVKCTEGDEFNKEVGFAMAVLKKMYGDRATYKRLIEDAEIQTRTTRKELIEKKGK